MPTVKAKKAAFLGLFTIVLVYLYFAYLVGPPRAEAEQLRREMEVSREQIRTGSRELEALRAREKAALSEVALDQRMQKLLDTMPTAYWVDGPVAISRLLEKRELADSKVRLFLVLPFRGVPDHVMAGWNISIPETHALRFGEALADLENRFPLGRLTDLSLLVKGDAGTVSVSMLFQMVVRQ